MPRIRRLFVFLAAFAMGCSATGSSLPEIDRDRLLITLQRSACFGSCPDYVVTIDGHGHVVFTTAPVPADDVSGLHRLHSRSNGVLVDGRHEDDVPVEAVDRLVEQFERADFFRLKDEYSAPITDNPTYVLTIDTGNGVKRVVDYVGAEIGMPPSVTELERAVDEVAGTARWVDGAPGLIEWLERSGFDFGSEQAVAIAAEGAWNEAADETLVALIGRGVPLEHKLQLNARMDAPLGEALMRGALDRGRPLLFDRLVALGWLDRLGRAEAAREFAESAGGCNPVLVAAVARARVSIDEAGDEGNTALRNLAGTYRCHSEAARVATARALLDLGANPNKRNDAGESAIFEVENAELLDLLYARGASASIKDEEGNSAVFSSWTDEIVLRHLRRGASVQGEYFDGKDLREQMRERPMPQVQAWLAKRSG